MRPRSFVSLVLLGAASFLAACSALTPIEPAGGGEQSRAGAADLAQVRAATAAFHNIDAARAAGYTVWSPDPFAPGATCPSDPAGKMGYHLVNVSLRGGAGDPGAGDALLDARTPEMLLYERRADGELRLVGVEYLVFKAAWERVHGVGAAAPTVLGQPLPFSSHTFVTGGPSIDHYELHVWLWAENPLGMFSPWNPNVTC
jgi:hypothetical protein